jgi:hypothetical protein
MAVGDFDGDGILDLAVANSAKFGGTPSVSVLLGNGDGIPDLVLVNTGGVRVLLGNGDGTFQTTSFIYMAGSFPYSVAVGDFNSDGWPDLAVANIYSYDVSILLNDALWTGPHPGRGEGASAGGRLSGSTIGMPTRLAGRYSASVVEAQLAEAACPDRRRATPAASVADPIPALPRDGARQFSVTTPATAAHREESPPPTHARLATVAPEPLLDLVFTDALAAGSDSSLIGDHDMRLA